MPNSYDLTQLDSATFEHMVNFLALKVLGNGTTGFAPGPDGGRDGYFQGEAPYPSETDRWSGVWYIQSKFHKPSLTKNANTWLADEVQKEIDLFLDMEKNRELPDIWIIATNIDPSGVSKTGAFDKIRKKVRALGKNINFDIWGGRKILDFLAENSDVASHYGHFLTPGNVITEMYQSLKDNTAQLESIINHLVVNQFNEQIYTKLEQAGSALDTRPKIHELFIDLPYKCSFQIEGNIFRSIINSSQNTHKIDAWLDFGTQWQEWARNVNRARVIVIKGGPGQGKSTIGQYFAQIQRAALILTDNGPKVSPATRQLAIDLKAASERSGFWPTCPRIPLTIELKDFAKWFGGRPDSEPRGIVTYIADRIRAKMEQTVAVGTLLRALSKRTWFITFDGLDEVPNDVKDDVANEIVTFTNEVIPSLNADILIICTTRPQGYSGQFEKLDAATVILSNLSPETALLCASAVVKFGRTPDEGDNSLSVLETAMESEQVRELMTTPLQSHIMAVVVRDGGRPPEKRWQLFENFYQVMKKRETLKGFGDQRIAKLLRESETLLKAIHSRLGICLHARAENSSGAETALGKEEFNTLAKTTTKMLIEENIDEVVDSLMEATTERLVFVSTPDDNQSFRFDIRQLQEFFAGEFLYTGVDLEELRTRIEYIAADSHWREVMHFLLSALIVSSRSIELTVAIQSLNNLDHSEDCSDTRLYKLRLAVGARLCLRLLNEGVLEQDKRVRGLFSTALKPLYALLSPATIETLSSINHTNSSSWLLSNLIDSVLEGSESEQIAAATALTRTLPNTHEKVGEVSRKISSSSNYYIEFICSVNTFTDFHLRFEHKKEFDVSEWFILIALEALLNSAAHDDKNPGINLTIIVDFLASHKNKLKKIIESGAWTDSEKELLSINLLNTSEELTEDERKNIDEIMYLEFQANWKNDNTLSEIVFEDDSSSPFLSATRKILRFSKNKTYDNYTAVIRAITPFEKHKRVFSDKIKSLIPVNFDDGAGGTALEQSSITEDEFETLLKNGKFGGSFISPIIKMISIRNIEESSWEEACDLFPYLCCDMWFSPEHFLTKKSGNLVKANSQKIAELIKLHPELVHRYILSWGTLFEKHPETRHIVIKSCIEAPAPDSSLFSSFLDISPFKINLPEELGVLPYLAESIIRRSKISRHFYNFKYFQAHLPRVKESDIAKFGITLTELLDASRNINNPISVRAGALGCYLAIESDSIQNSSDHFFTTLLPLFNEIKKDSPDWLVIALLIYSEGNLSPLDIRSERFLGKILSDYRNNFPISRTAYLIVSSWRERSSAPVQRHGALDQWLNYNVV